MTWLSLLRRVPREVWWLLVIATALCSALWSVQSYGDRRYADGRHDALAGARFDSVVTAPLRARVDTLAARVDTVVQRVVVRSHRVDTLLQQVPDTLWRVPELAALRVEVVALTRDVDTLTRVLALEREARHMERLVAMQQQRNAALAITALRDTVVTLRKRPTRVRAALYSTGALVVGATLGILKP